VHRIWADGEPRLLRFAEQRDLGYVALSEFNYTTRLLHGRGPMLRAADGKARWNAEYFRKLPLAALLLGGSGSADAGFTHVRHLMPRFASTMQARELPPVLPETWLYEIVAGAVVRGRAEPNATVRLHTAIRLRGQPIVHEAWTLAAPDGAFELVTPVPTNYRGVNLTTAPRAILSAGARDRIELAISERDVRSGATLHAD
jgi:hypothetical protein